MGHTIDDLKREALDHMRHVDVECAVCGKELCSSCWWADEHECYKIKKESPEAFAGEIKEDIDELFDGSVDKGEFDFRLETIISTVTLS